MRASAETVIQRPPEAVWEWAADPAHWHRWEPEFSGVHPDHYEIAQQTRPRRQVVRSVAGPFPFESTLELFPDVGGTRVRQTVSAGPEDALARFMFIVARPLARLKEMVELEAVL